MRWTAIVPIKGRGRRKTRLATVMSEAARDELAERMFAHVAGVVSAQPRVAEVLALSDSRPAGWDGAWAIDEGRGLNAELRAVSRHATGVPLLVVHADLPLLCGEDLAALIEAGERGCAIGPDRHEAGTNALALRDHDGFGFAFGAGSLRRHLSAAGEHAVVVRRRGIAFDVDTPHDLRQGKQSFFEKRTKKLGGWPR